MPCHHSLALHDGQAREHLVRGVNGAETDDIVCSSESLVTSGKGLPLAPFEHPVTVEVRPHLLLSPSACGAESGVYVRWDCHQLERFRVESQLLFQDAWAML